MKPVRLLQPAEHRFPYGLLYRAAVDEVVVLAEAHLHRRPAYWIGRR